MVDLSKFNQKWYIQGLNAVPIGINSAGFSGIVIEDDLGISYSIFVMEFKGNYCNMHYSVKSLDRIYDWLIKNHNQNKDFIKELQKKYYFKLKDLDKFFNNNNSKDKLDNLSKEEILLRLKEAMQYAIDAVGIAHIIEGFTIKADTIFKEMLLSEIDDKKMINRYISALLSFDFKSFMTLAEDEMKKLIEITDQTILDEKISEIITKYSWTKTSYGQKGIIAKEEILAEIQHFKTANYSINKSQKQKKAELLKELRLSENILNYLNLIELFTVWQDNRKANILKSQFSLFTILESLSKSINVEFDLLAFLNFYSELNDEFLSRNDLADILRQRQQKSIYLLEKDNVTIYTGNDHDLIVKELNKNASKGYKDDIHGMAASTGVAIGMVRKIMNMGDISNMQEGEILVTSMTRPEFVTAMKRASAIVTDEGGITCHAAIISRELGIPCIIGTKEATKLLNTGDKVEVNANHGIVKILDRK